MIVFGSMILFITGDERYVLGSLGSVTLGSILTAKPKTNHRESKQLI